MDRIVKYALLLFLPALALLSCEKQAGLEDNEFIYFGITQPYTPIGGIDFLINPSTMEITNTVPVPADIDLTAVPPWFVTSHEGKGVFVNGVRQTSGVTKQDLTQPVVYEVVSERETLRYTVKVVQSDLHTLTAVKLSLLGSPVSRIAEERQAWLADDVLFSDVVFEASSGRVIHLSMVEADLSRSGLGLTTLLPGNADEAPVEGASWPASTVLGQARDADGAGVEVLAAVNGGPYSVLSYEPDGPVVQDGKRLKDKLSDDEVRYFGFRRDGRLSMGTGGDFLSLYEKLVTAAGAESSLVEKLGPTDYAKADPFKGARIIAGMDSETLNKLYFVSIEGMGTESLSSREVSSCLIQLRIGNASCLAHDLRCSMVVAEQGGLSTVNRAGQTHSRVPCSLALVKR